MSWNFNYTAKGTKGRDAQVSVEEAMGGKPPCTLVTFAGVAEPSDAPCLEHGGRLWPVVRVKCSSPAPIHYTLDPTYAKSLPALVRSWSFGRFRTVPCSII